MNHTAVPKSLDVCVVAHTHWDREWYHSAPRFRQRLVALVDALLDHEPDPGRPFLLDGQAVILEDYLSVRPERTRDLQRHLEANALEAGPWYVLGDTLIPSGEAVVRNLLAGRRALRRLNAVAPQVAYCPDTFGHPAALPTIARGFGFPLALVWRGLGGARSPSSDVMTWRANSGEAVTLYHLPPGGYELGSALPADAQNAAIRWKTLAALLHARSNVAVVLLPNGADHHALQPDLDGAVTALQFAAAECGTSDRIVRTSLADFSHRLAAAVDARRQVIPEILGELRDSYGYTWTLGGTLATRAHQKRNNARAERALLRDVEPWLALAWLHGNASANTIAEDGTITLVQIPALLDMAWRTLLRAHPHDTLCGCSVDSVARAMDLRLSSATSQAAGLRTAALSMALQHDAVGARSRPLPTTATLIIRNRVPRSRGGVVELSLDETLGDEPVGPSSAQAAGGANETSHPLPPRTLFVDGVFLQNGSARIVRRRRESAQHYPDNDLVRAYRVIGWVSPVTPLGLSVHAMSSTVTTDGAPVTQSVPPFHPSTIEEHDGVTELNNGRVVVQVGPTGVTVIKDGRTIRNAVGFESARDEGDSYTPSIRGKPEQFTLRNHRVAMRGPLRGSVETLWSAGARRSQINVSATLILDAESDVLRIDIRGKNNHSNHRLRLLLATDVQSPADATSIWADAAFGPVLRKPLRVPALDQTLERVPPTMPMHRWVTISNFERGATLHSDGLAEVEVQGEGVIALTLLRAIGELSRNDLPERPGHAGWPAHIPLAQSQGRFRARTALHLHGAWSATIRDQIETESDSLLLPLIGETWRDLVRPHHHLCGPELQGQGLRWSTVSLADNNDGLVLRCINDSEIERSGAWVFPAGQWEFARSRIDETLLESWQACDSRIEFSVRPLNVLTICVRRRAH